MGILYNNILFIADAERRHTRNVNLDSFRHHTEKSGRNERISIILIIFGKMGEDRTKVQIVKSSHLIATKGTSANIFFFLFFFFRHEVICLVKHGIDSLSLRPLLNKIRFSCTSAKIEL